MALIEDVKRVCDRLAPLGWRDLLLAHGLDITAANLQQELAKELPNINRTLKGFEDFPFEGKRGIESGSAALSLLFHAFASPNVISENVREYPTLEEFEIIENYIYGVQPPSLEDLRDQEWTRLSLVDHKIPKDWLPDEFHGLKTHGKMQAVDVTWRIVSQPTGSGYLMVGDAAMVLDPASSHEVLKAIMSGIMAGYLIAAELLENLTPAQATQHYCQSINNWFEHDVENLSKLYAMLP